MGEGKRRSDVKVFEHRKNIPTYPWSMQPSLFGDSLRYDSRPWDCTPTAALTLTAGAEVLVIVQQNGRPCVILGNQAVAEITGDQGANLALALKETGWSGGVPATIVSTCPDGRFFSIRIAEDSAEGAAGG